MRLTVSLLLLIWILESPTVYAIHSCENALENHSSPYTRFIRVPGILSGPIAQGRPGRYLLTRMISEKDVRHSNSLRSPRASRHEQFKNINSIPHIALQRITDIHLTSEFGGGTQRSDVRLAYLLDGSPVAIKTYQEFPQRMLLEAQSAEFLDALGIGARFWGIYREENGTDNIVMDLIAGDHLSIRKDGNSTYPITLQTMIDFEEIFKRLKQGGIKGFAELQLYITPSSRLMVIDPDELVLGISEKYIQRGPLNMTEYINEDRAHLLGLASEDVKIMYNNWLKAHGSAFGQ